jgi:2-oxoglutarate dehydrogenase E1 component
MTEQSANSQFRAGSFMDGANADYIDQLAARHAADPSSVDARSRQSGPPPAPPGRAATGRRSLQMI